MEAVAVGIWPPWLFCRAQGCLQSTTEWVAAGSGKVAVFLSRPLLSGCGRRRRHGRCCRPVGCGGGRR